MRLRTWPEGFWLHPPNRGRSVDAPASSEFLDDWQNQINHLLAQEEAHRRELPGEVKKALVELSR